LFRDLEVPAYMGSESYRMKNREGGSSFRWNDNSGEGDREIPAFAGIGFSKLILVEIMPSRFSFSIRL